ncbi:MAG TPA: hypothetical protein VHY56_10825, partial [Candidatus Binataceae bacterium]|nr:hypothetical protein [Candidatus Binataceae bacterium]
MLKSLNRDLSSRGYACWTRLCSLRCRGGVVTVLGLALLLGASAALAQGYNSGGYSGGSGGG